MPISMNKLFIALCFLGIYIPAYEQTLATSELLPKYAVSGSTVGSRMMTVCRMTLSFGGGNGNKLYRYFTGVSTNLSLGTGTVSQGGFFVLRTSALSNGQSIDISGF